MRIFALVAALLAAAAPSPSPAPSLSPAPKFVVHMHDFAFVPVSVTIHAGDAVTFINDDPVTHDVTADSFQSGPLEAGKHWTHAFAAAGTYAYICSYHASMKGTIVVKPE